jgi:hypothetical protein
MDSGRLSGETHAAKHSDLSSKQQSSAGPGECGLARAVNVGLQQAVFQTTCGGKKVRRVEERETVVERPWLREDCCLCVVEGVNRVTSFWWYQRRQGARGVVLGGGGCGHAPVFHLHSSSSAVCAAVPSLPVSVGIRDGKVHVVSYWVAAAVGTRLSSTSTAAPPPCAQPCPRLPETPPPPPPPRAAPILR